MRLVAFVVLGAALLSACAGTAQQPAGMGTTTTGPAVTSTAATTAGLPRSEPTELWIPRIGARSSLIPLALNEDGTVEVPPVERPLQAGWYSLGPTPGEPGPAVVLGHVDGYHQPGIFYRLHELAPGDGIEISRADGTVVRFVVRKVDQVAKTHFPTDAVYGQTPGPELRLITCGGLFDPAARSYVDNIIAYATKSEE